MVIAQTPRLVIRHFRMDDAAFLLELVNEAQFIAQINDKGVRNLEQAQAYLQDNFLSSYADTGYCLNVVALRHNQTLIGTCGLIKREQFELPDLGFAYLERYCGQGYGFEAAQAVLEHGHRQLHFNQVLAFTKQTNLASQKLLEKLGFKHQGLHQLYPGDSEDFMLSYQFD